VTPGFSIGDRRVHPSLNRIDGPEGAVQLEPKVMEVLTCLAGRDGGVVSKEELVREVWEGRFVSDDVVWRSIGELRRALGDDARKPAYIQTIPKRGYRLVMNGAAATADGTAPAPPAMRRRLIPRSLLAAAFLLGFGSLVTVLLVSSRRAPDTASPYTATNAAARDSYLKGLWFLNRGTTDDLRKSVPAFEQAAALDPGSARAHAGLADAVHLLTLFGALPPREAYPRAEAEARQALELDPTLADTHSTLGSILFRFHRDGPGAEAEFRRALALNPQSATAHHDYAWLLVAERRFDEALEQIQAAQRLEPLSVRASADVGWVYFRARRYGEAIHQMQRTLEMEPRFLGARLCLERALVAESRLGEALAHAKEGARQQGMTDAEMAALPTDPRTALRRVAEWRLRRLQESRQKGWVSPYALAAQHAELGDADPTFAELERAFAESDPSLVSADVDPAFDPVRSDPRFAQVVARIGLRRG
jgi:DNA-binding winged helix-turn-helix (wHTH) protein/anti-sigma factor ChrR (cupin superfamily)